MSSRLHRFSRAVLGADVRGYPERVQFVSSDVTNLEATVWANLSEGRLPTVVVEGDVETLIIPTPRLFPFGLIDRKRGRVKVRVWQRKRNIVPAGFGVDGPRVYVGDRPYRDARRVVRSRPLPV